MRNPQPNQHEKTHRVQPALDGWGYWIFGILCSYFPLEITGMGKNGQR